MNAQDSGLVLKDACYEIVGAAMEVSRCLGCGFLEAVYQEALKIEFEERKIPCVPQQRIAIVYKGKMLDKEYIVDFLCCDTSVPVLDVQ